MNSFLIFIIFCYILIIVVESEKDMSPRTLFDYEVLDHKGELVQLSKYKDAKAIIVVNVASKCGYTYDNYRELVQLYDKYHSKGLEILAFPCNNFGLQEPGTNEEIQKFTHNYGIQFPVFAKIDIVKDQDPVFKFLRISSNHIGIQWNFIKFLLINGRPVRRYAQTVNPNKMEKDIIKVLKLENEFDL
jgi:glutathione peroxidase